MEIPLDGMRPARIDLVLFWPEAATTWSRERGLNENARPGIAVVDLCPRRREVVQREEPERKRAAQHSDQTRQRDVAVESSQVKSSHSGPREVWLVNAVENVVAASRGRNCTVEREGRDSCEQEVR